MLGTVLIVVLSIAGGVLSDDINCSLDVERLCGKISDDWKGQTWPEDQQQLRKACGIGNVLDCQMKYAENCPKSLLRAFLEYLIETKSLHNELCGNNYAFKKQYLRNVKCLNNHVTNLFNNCRKITKGNSADLCGNTVALRNCIAEGVKQKCGSEASHVFDVLDKPALAIEKIFCKKGTENNFIF